MLPGVRLHHSGRQPLSARQVGVILASKGNPTMRKRRSRRFWRHTPLRRHRQFRRHRRHAHRLTLADVSPGVLARIIGLEDLPRPARIKLLALGLVPGRLVEVIRHKPVTLVRAEHSELALEDELADGITVKTEQDSPPNE